MIDPKALFDECRALSDRELLRQLKLLAASERTEIIKILVRLGELGARELEKLTGYSSMFKYCVRELKFSESTAFFRVTAASACRSYSDLLEHLESGELNVTSVALIADHLTFENHKTLIKAAKGLSRRELERHLAGLRPRAKPPERTRVIAVPAPPPAEPRDASRSASGGEQAPDPSLDLPASPPLVEIRTEHRFTVKDETEAKLQRARELLSHKFPFGELESIFDVALDALLEKLEPSKRPKADAPPRPADRQTRRIPEWVKRVVRARDGNRCAYVSLEGHRCAERLFLQFDHVRPWTDGGSSDDPANVRQVCATHNRWLWRRRASDALEGRA